MQGEQKLKKMLLMGQHKAGKTSMHSIIFANSPPRETMGIGLTVGVNQNQLRFMGNLTLNLWDCGGQDQLYNNYFTTQKETMFSNVQVLIYVLDVEKEGKPYEDELQDYRNMIENLSEFSPEAIVFVLIHKFDKIKENDKKIVFERKYSDVMKKAENLKVEIREVIATSIWDETLYKAWSTIVQHLIPNIRTIKDSLISFCELCNCEEVVLFEKSTFLIIAFHEMGDKKDITKYERLSNIIKQFKLSCMKINSQIQGISVRSNKFTTYIDEFTDNTFIMLVYNDQSIQPASIAHNVSMIRKQFEKIEGTDTDKLKVLIRK